VSQTKSLHWKACHQKLENQNLIKQKPIGSDQLNLCQSWNREKNNQIVNSKLNTDA